MDEEASRTIKNNEKERGRKKMITDKETVGGGRKKGKTAQKKEQWGNKKNVK